MEQDVDQDRGDDRQGDGGEHRGVVGKELAHEEADAELQGTRRHRAGEQQRVDELVPGEQKHERAGGHQPHLRQRHHDAGVAPGEAAAVDHCRLLQLARHSAHKAVQQEHRYRHVDGGVGQRQPEQRIVQAGDRDQAKVGHHQGDHRHQHPGHDQVEHQLPAAKPLPRQHEPGHRAERQVERH